MDNSYPQLYPTRPLSPPQLIMDENFIHLPLNFRVSEAIASDIRTPKENKEDPLEYNGSDLSSHDNSSSSEDLLTVPHTDHGPDLSLAPSPSPFLLYNSPSEQDQNFLQIPLEEHQQRFLSPYGQEDPDLLEIPYERQPQPYPSPYDIPAPPQDTLPAPPRLVGHPRSQSEGSRPRSWLDWDNVTGVRTFPRPPTSRRGNILFPNTPMTYSPWSAETAVDPASQFRKDVALITIPQEMGGKLRQGMDPEAISKDIEEWESRWNLTGNQSLNSSAGAQFVFEDNSGRSSEVSAEHTTISTLKKKYETQFLCLFPGCRKTFTRHSNLSGHMRSHGVEPFLCPLPGCGKTFLNQTLRERHRKTHVNKTICDGCGERFLGRTELIMHECYQSVEEKIASLFEGSSTMSQTSSQSSEIKDSSKTRENTTSLLVNVFKSVPHYKQLLSCDESDAQKVLDAFQQLLDTESFSDRAQLIIAMRRLSERTKQYPTSFSLIGPSPTPEDEPVTFGSFADIYKIVFHGEETCYKVIRVYQRSQVDHLAKVYAREAILWAQLSHPNILPFYGLVKFRSRLAFVSRWALNGSLEDYLTTHPDANRVLLCMDTAAGVNYLHENDIVHGDLKGVNVLIDSAGRACLGDFGLSSVYDPKVLRWTSQSSMASKGGTTRWKAPELVRSEDTAKKAYNSKASDVYAWASVCYEIFTEQLPFHEALNDANVILNIMQGSIPMRPPADHLAWLQHGLNDCIWDLMKDCWAFEPTKRPTMTTVISRLNPETPTDSRPAGEWVEKDAMRFRNANVVSDTLVDILKEPSQFWEGLETLLRRLVPGTASDEFIVDVSSDPLGF